jgi:MFS family permease
LDLEAGRAQTVAVPEAAGERRGTVTFWVLCGATLGTFVAQGLLYPALPLYLIEDLGTSKAVAGLVVSSTSVAAVAVRPWAGGFIDRRGRKPLLVAGPLITAATGLGLLAFHSVAAVLVLRLAQGAGNALAYSAAAAMAADLAPVDRRARYLARFGMFFYIGFAAGPWLAELLIGGPGFGAVWWTVAAASAAAAAVGALLPETGLTLTGSDRTVPRLSVWHRLFHPAAVGPGIVFFCVGVGWAALAAFLAIYARDIGLATSDSLFLVLSLTVLATRALAGSLADRFGPNVVLYPCIASVVAGQLVLAAFREPATAYLGLVLFGAGFSGLFPVLFTMVVDRAPEAERGAAMSSFNVFYDIGAPLGGYGVGALIDAGGFGAGFGATAVLAGAGGIALAAYNRSLRTPGAWRAETASSPPRG